MMKWLALFIGMAYAQTAGSQSYLIFPNQAACLTRSQQMCVAMGCDGVHTIFWWDCSTGPLSAGTAGSTAVTAGSYAMKIESSGRFTATTSNVVSNGTQGLSASEQSSLVTAAAIASVFPTVAH